MSIIRQVALASALFSAGTGFASAQEMKAEVLHWWTSGGESAAVKVFADQFKAAGGTWVDTAIAGGETARTAGINRIVGGNPPTVMQFNTGKQFDELVANDLLRDIDDVAAAGKWREVLPPAIVDATTRDGKFYAVPVNIHGQNWLCYNTKVLADAGVEPPTTYEEMLAAGPKLKAAGHDPAGPGRPALAGAAAVQFGAAGRGRPRTIHGRLPRQGSGRRQGTEVPQGRRYFRPAAQPDRSGQPRPQLERRHRPRHHRQGRRCR